MSPDVRAEGNAEALAAAAMEAAVAAVWEDAKATIADQVAVVEQAARAVAAGRFDDHVCRRGQQEAHKLAGSLGTFGLNKASETARDIELLLQAGVGRDDPDTGRVLLLAELAVTLRREFELGRRRPPPPPVDQDSDLPHLLVIGAAAESAHQLAIEGHARDLHVECVPGPAGARPRLAKRRPGVIVLQLRPDRDAEAALCLLDEVSELGIPVAVITAPGPFTDRLDMARFGGRAFLDETASPSQVLDAVCELADRQQASGMTVLAVDDDPSILATLEALIEPHGSKVVTLDDPWQFWKTLQEVDPHLLLLDVEMPGVTGLELCRVVRNDARWRQVPVLFLTADTQRQTIERLFASGADDYVAKPIVGPELVSRMRNRLERARLNRDLAQLDPLTGVANRATSAQVVQRLTRLAARRGQPVAVALVEADGLKHVNARHGHASGDKVLGCLGRFLGRAFHGDDLVARWSGAQFLVAMYATTACDGVQRLAGVLEAMRQETFVGGDGESFTSAFSAGVAQYPDDGDDLAALHGRADAVLRESRRAGGDRVLAAGDLPEDDPDVTTYDVAVVDDDEALAELLVHALEAKGCRTWWTTDGDEAAAALSGPLARVDARVILLGWNLPGLDGLQVLGMLKDTGVLGRSRVIMLTAGASESEVLQGLSLGAFDHVPKPFSVPVLAQRVHRVLEP